jgi:hypothetical protein
MFRKRSPQSNIFECSNLVPRKKAKRLEKSWAEPFRARALPLIDEERFAPLYCQDNGRPNQPVQVVFGTLILKEMFNLTDEEALEQLEFNLLWHHALCVTPEEAHLCQKTLHNFRARLMTDDNGRLAFAETTDRIIVALGLRTERQRLDSTHIVSNIAMLTRLGLFCETIRVFLAAVGREHPRLSKEVSEKLRGRYFHDNGDTTRYQDARSKAARRRIAVCARDLYRLHSLFRGTAAAGLDEYVLLERVLEEQCDVVGRKGDPTDDDDDAGEGGVPVRCKEPKDVSSSSLQTPHDPDVTYSGHKGKGYEVQVTETCHEENVVEMITHVEVTDSCGSDADATLAMLDVLEERGLQPEELVADTTYGSGNNAVDAECMGTELVSPVGGKSVAVDDLSAEDRGLRAAEFTIDASHGRPTVCPAGHESIDETEKAGSPNRVGITFARGTCEACEKYMRCPARLNVARGGYVLSVDLVAYNLERRRRAEASGEFAARYAIRAGIEATNSELKRKHGLGKLRVRGRPRVELSVYVKALSCNFKRMVQVLLAEMLLPDAAEA